MIGTAILADGIQVFLTLILIGPFVNWLISIFAWLTFFFWFYLKGVNFTNNPKKIFTLAGGSLLEASQSLLLSLFGHLQYPQLFLWTRQKAN